MRRAGLVGRAAAVVIAAPFLSACVTERSGETPLPSLYLALATPAAQVDAATARDMISAYRAKTGLPPLALDRKSVV